MKILVSSCLLGINCKYNGKNNLVEDIRNLSNEYEIISVCPEQLGGLPTPRIPSEIIKNKVINKENVDVTKLFNKGAVKTLDIVKKHSVNIAILKQNSPSCGYGTIYDGTFSGKLINGNGITSDLLFKNGIVILNEENYKEYLKRL